ncbi:hypothetical protein KFL_000890300 [Klebsormidium nitens]|uniref:Uncharacterized protein n=1 Tax=Klebsormidium nitens TaxID=105231 RepID=A0A1Y1HXR3_KLENI|nr:hypothetical protein KFL_000890300 [Klebsormidium nitens]|eukprot:GAQ81741.1 hypothetical protein KFL_000890300 [Klebsormidium nitens]
MLAGWRGNGRTERLLGANIRGTTTAQQEPLLERGATHAQAAAAASHGAEEGHRNEGPPLTTATESASSDVTRRHQAA